MYLGLAQKQIHILARAPGGQMRGAATQAMPGCIVEERQADTRPSPPRPSGLRPAGPPALAHGHMGDYRWRSRPAYRPGYSSSLGPRQRAWGPAAKCEVISARALR